MDTVIAAPSLSINDVSVTEGDIGTVMATFTVTLSAISSQTVTVDYATAPYTAASGLDFSPTSGTLTFDPGQTTQTIDVDVIGDTLPEGLETFRVNLSSAASATIADSQGIGTILNDDLPSRVFVSVLGSNSNDCSNIATPCLTLNAAIAKVAVDGEVILIRSGSYAGAMITKAVKVTAAAGVVAFSGQPITVNAGSGTVALRGLTLKALNPGTGDGILVQAAGAVFVENCVIDGWDVGIRQQGTAEIFVKDSTLRSNTTGILATAGQASIENSRLSNNSVGLAAAGTATVSVRGSTVSGNTTGISADSGASVTVEKSQIANNGTGITLPAASLSTVQLSRSVVSGNSLGLENVGGALQVTATNVVRGNAVDTSGTITTVGLQ
jgi:hypothetical protein